MKGRGAGVDPSAWRAPTAWANASSNALVLGPVVNQPLRSVSTTASISRSLMLGSANGILGYWFDPVEGGDFAASMNGACWRRS